MSGTRPSYDTVSVALHPLPSSINIFIGDIVGEVFDPSWQTR